jgi:glycosyltransferase involved in cell wall biosynthesis
MNTNNTIDLVCFSYLRWDFMYQRPQHLMTRFAKIFRVIYVEPAITAPDNSPFEINHPSQNIITVTPHLPAGLSEEAALLLQQERLSRIFNDLNIQRYLFWFYTPEVLPFTQSYSPLLKVYDCVTEFSAGKSAPEQARQQEEQLLQQVDFVFTAGHSLFESKRINNQNTYCFAGSVDIDHFYSARYYTPDPEDQAHISHPRFGFAGIIDDRIDFQLLSAIALRKPDWNFVMLGPVIGISESDLPNLPNIHFIGRKGYEELVTYISGWDVAMLPFAHNDATRYMNPLQTPEFLAAGKPVIAAPVNDIIRTYGHRGLVQIAGTAEEFVRVGEIHLSTRDKTEWQEAVIDFLSLNSWDKTWQRMIDVMSPVLQASIRQDVVEPSDKICA